MFKQSAKTNFIQQPTKHIEASSRGFSHSDAHAKEIDSTFGWERLYKDFNSLFGREESRPDEVSVNGCRDVLLCVRRTSNLREIHSIGVQS